MKKIILTLLLTTLSAFSVVTFPLFNKYVTSFVEEESCGFRYTYQMRPRDFDKKDMSYFKVFYVDGGPIQSPSSTLRFKQEFEKDSFTWKSLKGDNEGLVEFSFFSQYSPTIGDAEFKIGNKTYFDRVHTISCNFIPEPSTTLFISFGALAFLRRKR
jgi:hypothetical protein